MGQKMDGESSITTTNLSSIFTFEDDNTPTLVSSRKVITSLIEFNSRKNIGFDEVIVCILFAKAL